MYQVFYVEGKEVTLMESCVPTDQVKTMILSGVYDQCYVFDQNTKTMDMQVTRGEGVVYAKDPLWRDELQEYLAVAAEGGHRHEG